MRVISHLVNFRPNCPTIRRLVLEENKHLNELYCISAGGQDLILGLDPEVILAAEAGLVENGTIRRKSNEETSNLNSRH